MFRADSLYATSEHGNTLLGSCKTSCMTLQVTDPDRLGAFPRLCLNPPVEAEQAVHKSILNRSRLSVFI